MAKLCLELRERERERERSYMHCEIVSYVLKFIICWVHPSTVDYCTERTIKETRDWKDEWEKRHQRGQLWWVSSLYSLVLCGVVWSDVPHSVINFWSLRPMQHWMPLMVWLSFWIIYHYTVESTSAVTTWIPFYPHHD